MGGCNNADGGFSAGDDMRVLIRDFRSDERAVASTIGTVMALLRSEEHTSELQSQSNLVCRLLLEKKKKLVEERVAKVSRLRCGPVCSSHLAPFCTSSRALVGASRAISIHCSLPSRPHGNNIDHLR